MRELLDENIHQSIASLLTFSAKPNIQDQAHLEQHNVLTAQSEQTDGIQMLHLLCWPVRYVAVAVMKVKGLSRTKAEETEASDHLEKPAAAYFSKTACVHLPLSPLPQLVASRGEAEEARRGHHSPRQPSAAVITNG